MSKYYGHGDFNPNEIFKGYRNGAKCKELVTWMSMLDRCYGKTNNGMVMSARWLQYREFAHDYVTAYHDMLRDHSFSAVAALDLEAVVESLNGRVFNTNFGQPRREYGESTTFFITPRLVRLLRSPDASRELAGVRKQRGKYTAYGRKKHATFAKVLGTFNTIGAAHAAWRRHQLELIDEAVCEMERRAVQLRTVTVNANKDPSKCYAYEDFIGLSAFESYKLGIMQIRLWMSAFKTGVVAPVAAKDRDDFEKHMAPYFNELDRVMLATYYSANIAACTEIGKQCRDIAVTQTSIDTAMSLELYYQETVGSKQLSSMPADSELEAQLKVKQALDAMVYAPKPAPTPKPAATATEPDPFYAVSEPILSATSNKDLVGNDGFEKVPQAVWDMWIDADPWLRADMGYDERIHGKLPEKAQASEPESEAQAIRKIQDEFRVLDAEAQQKYFDAWVKANVPKFDDFKNDWDYDIALEAYGDLRERIFTPQLTKF